MCYKMVCGVWKVCTCGSECVRVRGGGVVWKAQHQRPQKEVEVGGKERKGGRDEKKERKEKQIEGKKEWVMRKPD